MIEKVRLDPNVQKYRVNPTTRKIPTEELYAKDPGEQGVIYEPSQKKEQKDSLTLSSIYEAPKEETEKKPETFGEKVGAVLGKAVSAIRAFFSKLWNGPEKAVNPVNETEAAPAAEEQELKIPAEEPVPEVRAADSDDFLREIVKTRDRAKLMNYVTENGKKHLAKNSDLLTSYDRSGRIVSVSPSDKRLILEGDFRDIRL